MKYKMRASLKIDLSVTHMLLEMLRVKSKKHVIKHTVQVMKGLTRTRANSLKGVPRHAHYGDVYASVGLLLLTTYCIMYTLHASYSRMCDWCAYMYNTDYFFLYACIML
jgi:hypothetical protein